MLVQCPTCRWRYLPYRAREHLAIHDLLPVWPCPVRTDVGDNLSPLQLPVDLSAILVHGLYQLQPERQVL